jgi:alpha,alpha-trehalase
MLVAEDEHMNVWLGRHQPHKRLMQCGLSRYFDANYLSELAACESGWDHSNRCDDRWLDYLPVDLNSILYARELDFAQAARLLGDETKASHWQTIAADRAQKVIELMWDEEREFFFDCHAETYEKDATLTLAGFFPLWAGLATQEQARRVVAQWLPKFEKGGGLVTSLEPKDGRQWCYPNGWAPLQWLVAEGLDKYNFHEEAARVRLRWCLNCLDTFTETGALWEKYNVVEPGNLPEAGLYGSIKGFGWTNSVFVDFARKLDKRAQSLTYINESRLTPPLVVHHAPAAEVSSFSSH